MQLRCGAHQRAGFVEGQRVSALENAERAEGLELRGELGYAGTIMRNEAAHGGGEVLLSPAESGGVGGDDAAEVVVTHAGLRDVEALAEALQA